MKAQKRTTKLAAVAAALLLGAIGYAQAQEEDTNITTVAYWKLANTNTDPNNVIFGLGIPDLATNTGQGVVPGIDGLPVPVSVQNLWVLGNAASAWVNSSAVPPTSMFNPSGYFNAGTGSFDSGATMTGGGELSCDNLAYGNNFNEPNFTEECFFKTDYTNDPVLGTQKQTLFWEHKFSNYGVLQLNESAAGNTNDIGSLLFWGWNVVNFPTVRVTAAQNGGHRFDDGQWHYACCRYNGANLTMDLLVVNQDGTSAESTTYIGSPLNPGGSGSQGPYEIANDEGGGTPFLGLINQVRFSSAALPVNQLLANVTGCNAPVFPSASPSTNALAVGSALNITPVFVPAEVQGGPLQFQWQNNGNDIAGQTNINLNLFPASLASAGTYQLIASTPCGSSATSAPVVVTVAQAVPLTRWSFEFVEDTTFPQATIDDVLPNENYDLITFNDASPAPSIGGNGGIALTNVVPPTSMFINGHNGGAYAFDPSFISSVNGVVFYPLGPDVFDFQGSFSLELFFRTYGDQSANGAMELLSQGSDGGNTIRYSLVANQAAPGAVSFHINNFSVAPAGPSFEDTNAGIQTVTLSDKNYADGNWHYLLATYNAVANNVSLSIVNADNTGTNAVVGLPAGYSPLPNLTEGNLFVGRYRYPLNDGAQTDPRTFIGSIDEVQVSSGLITPSSGQLGYLPTPPVITGISLSGSTVTINFTGAPGALASSYSVVSSTVINGALSTDSATVTALGGGSFQATLAKSGAAQYYRIKH